MARRFSRRRFLRAAGLLGVVGLSGSAGHSFERNSGFPRRGRAAIPGVESTWTGTDSHVGDGDPPARVGAHYYPWWGTDPAVHWDGHYWGSPARGEYESRDPAVIEDHVALALAHGIDWLSVSWWGPDSYAGRTFEDHLLAADVDDRMALSVLYESTGRLGGLPIDFDESAPRQQLVADFEYFQEHLFPAERYLRVDGRPLVFVYVARGFEGDVSGAFTEARAAIDDDPYVVADLGFEPGPVSEAYDAVSRYDVYAGAPDWATLVERTLPGYRAWYDAAREGGFAFLPGVTPGFAKPAEPDLPVLERSPSAYRRLCREVGPLATGDLEAVLITSFNEWHEGTQIEPGWNEDGESYGETFLEVTAEELGDG